MYDEGETCRKMMYLSLMLTILTASLTIWLGLSSHPTPVTVIADPPVLSTEGGLYFQNNTPENMWVAIGYIDDSGQWFSQGWLTLEPGEKRRGIAGLLNKRYYTYYARNFNESNPIVQGDRQFWIKSNNDNWKNIAMGLASHDAAKQGFQSRSFRLIDIGSPTKKSFTVTFP